MKQCVSVLIVEADGARLEHHVEGTQHQADDRREAQHDHLCRSFTVRRGGTASSFNTVASLNQPSTCQYAGKDKSGRTTWPRLILVHQGSVLRGFGCIWGDMPDGSMKGRALVPVPKGLAGPEGALPALPKGLATGFGAPRC